jgi:hypothetical protein
VRRGSLLENVGEVVLAGRPAPGAVARYVRAVGRLVAIRIGRVASVADVASVHADILGVLDLSSSGPDYVFCSDCRAGVPLPPDAVDAWSRLMRDINHRVARGGMLVDAASAMFRLQAERAVRCAAKSERVLFTDPDLLIRWLDDALDERERAELRRFLSQPLA